MTVRDLDIRPVHVLAVASIVGCLLSGFIPIDLWRHPSRLWSPGIVFALAVSIAIRQFAPISLRRIGAAMLVTVVTYYLAILSFLLTFWVSWVFLHLLRDTSPEMMLASLFPSGVVGLIGALLTVGSFVFFPPFKRRFRRWRRAMLGGIVGGAVCAIGLEVILILHSLRHPFWPGVVVWLVAVAAAFGYSIELSLAWEDKSQRLTDTI